MSSPWRYNALQSTGIAMVGDDRDDHPPEIRGCPAPGVSGQAGLRDSLARGLQPVLQRQGRPGSADSRLGTIPATRLDVGWVGKRFKGRMQTWLAGNDLLPGSAVVQPPGVTAPMPVTHTFAARSNFTAPHQTNLFPGRLRLREGQRAKSGGVDRRGHRPTYPAHAAVTKNACRLAG